MWAIYCGDLEAKKWMQAITLEDEKRVLDKREELMAQKCAICGREWGGILGVGFYRCRICGRLVCDHCQNDKVCKICQEKMK